MAIQQAEPRVVIMLRLPVELHDRIVESTRTQRNSKNQLIVDVLNTFYEQQHTADNTNHS